LIAHIPGSRQFSQGHRFSRAMKASESSATLWSPLNPPGWVSAAVVCVGERSKFALVEEQRAATVGVSATRAAVGRGPRGRRERLFEGVEGGHTVPVARTGGSEECCGIAGIEVGAS
jgi:hypothetical protein